MAQRIIIIFLILIIVLGGGMYAYKELMPPVDQEATGPVYSTKPVVRGDISVGVEVVGGLDPSNSGGLRVPGDYRSGGMQYTLKELFVKEGDSVKAGQLVAKLDSPGLDTSLKTKQEELDAKSQALADLCMVPVSQINSINPARGITISAPADGNVTDLDVEEGKELNIGQIIGRIVDNSKFRMEFKIFVAEYGKVRTGQEVELRFPYFDGSTPGVITYINSNPVPFKSGDGFAEGYAHSAIIEGKNLGLIQRDMEATVGVKDENGDIFYFANKAKVTGFAQDEKIVNTVKAVVTKVHVENMDRVKEGDPIVTMAGSDIQKEIQTKLDEIRQLRNEIQELMAQKQNMDVLAPMDGIVAGIYRQVGEQLMPGDWFGSLYTVSDMQMWSMVDDIDVINIRVGSPVKVSVDAVPGRTFEGRVTYVSTMAEVIDGKTRKFRVGINVTGDGDLKPGMQAKAYIDAGSAKDVLLVPIEAIFEESGAMKVEILKEDGTTSVVTVTVGLMNDRVVEIKEGLNEGDLVITGSTADLLPSQHIKSDRALIPDGSGSPTPSPGPQG